MLMSMDLQEYRTPYSLRLNVNDQNFKEEAHWQNLELIHTEFLIFCVFTLEIINQIHCPWAVLPC